MLYCISLLRTIITIHSIKGLQKEGAVGLLKGTGRGLVGLLVRPTGGLVDLASGTLDFVTRYANFSNLFTNFSNLFTNFRGVFVIVALVMIDNY